jgi:CheY-like chemotaxis protein
MGGRLAVQTQEGLGSTFAFELPLPRVRDAAPPSHEEKGPEPDLPPIRILAAEDSKPNQLVLKALLEPLGLEVSVVPDGREAVRAFQEDNFDLVLMDVQMPNMNGIEATMAIRAFEAEHCRSRTPILALSANVMSHQLMDYAAAGMDGCVAKPIDAGALIESIRGALDIQPAAKTSGRRREATSAAQ